MGDSRHKASPPDYPEETITEPFVASVWKKLASNRLHNEAMRLGKDDDDYRISNHAELAAVATNGDKTLLSRIIGPAKPTTTVKRLTSSRFVGAIRAALEIPAPRRSALDVPTDRVDTMKLIGDLSDDDFAILEQAVAKSLGRSRRK